MMPAVSARVDLVTPAEPDQGVPSSVRARFKAAALGVVGALLVPLPAAAAPAPCEQALRYAAQSGAELIRIGNLDLGPAGRDHEPIKNVGVGDAKSALVAQSAINAAALGRVLDGGPADRKALTEVFQQTAPPTHQRPEKRRHDTTTVGPFSLGSSELTVHARWDPAMACGNSAGEATRAEAELRRAGVLEDGDAALVRVPGKMSSRSTTAMERRGPAARAVAAASLAGGMIELLGGAVELKIVRPPSLLATMSSADGGEVRYQPAVLEVSGAGFTTARLDTAGDNVELRLDEAGKPVGADTDSKAGTGSDGDPGTNSDSDSGPDTHSDSRPGNHSGKDPGTDTDGSRTSDTADDRGSGEHESGKSGRGYFSRLPEIGALGSAAPLPLPSLPGVPPLADPGTEPGTEAAPAAGSGTTVRISLGDVRQAVSGHAIAAKATAMNIAITKGPDGQTYGDSAPNRSGVILDLDMGLLEVAAVAPEPAGGASSVAGDVSGGAAGLPITGPRVDLLALTGVALLIAGAAALIFGMRGRSRP